MPGLGVPELFIIVLVVVVLFGAPLLTFFMGYAVGKARATQPDTADSSAPATTVDADPVATDASSEESTHE